ncbi:DUF2075 domain-containing protein [Patescibacteria group bacterium]|nr:DUF2075 domain-containing protein [Patescibacteria group bacterium]
MPIIYSKTKKEFTEDVFSNSIENFFVRETGPIFGGNQMTAIRNSMNYMDRVVRDSGIPDNAGIAIEYKIPSSSRRIDFIITGKDTNRNPIAVLVELKQWEKAELTEMDGVVKTFVGGSIREVEHPSYQVWSYATFIKDFNESIEENDISLEPCAYLHNYEKDNVIDNDLYKFYTEQAPVFYKADAQKLQDFIKTFVKYGDDKETLYLIENGKIKPSKGLADCLASLLKNNKKEFTLIDDQKLVYEKALELARKSTELNKNVFIVEGGPGTGKSVVAINLLSELTSKGDNVRYVTKNSAPRRVFEVKLSGVFSATRIRNLLTSSGSFYNAEKNSFNALIVDESHRLNLKTGMFKKGENQIKEIINASNFCIFFIDENQRIETSDIGRKEYIKEIASELGANILEAELPSQFRCNGDDGYLPWLDNLLQIKETANETLEGIDYDFKIFDDAKLVHEEIIRLNKHNKKSRMVAGYCWEWISKKNRDLKDIIIDDYRATWNLTEHGQAWLVHPESVTEIGCIHTCQGLDLDYVGVIIGPDLIVRNGKIITDGTKRATTDRSLWGITQQIREGEPSALGTADMIIKNTYRTLMTRGMKGCYIYCTDPETQQYFKERLSRNSHKTVQYGSKSGESLSFDK